jgi:D-alanyl-D-alanine dipeptidase
LAVINLLSNITKAALVMFVVIILMFIVFPWTIDLAKSFGFFNEENQTMANYSSKSLQTEINSLLSKDKCLGYAFVDKFNLEEDSILIGFDYNCRNDSSGNCPYIKEGNGCDSKHAIPKPNECGDKACICYYKDSGLNDFFGRNWYLACSNKPDEAKTNFIKDSCKLFDGNVTFRGDLINPFNFGKVIKDNETYFVNYYNGKDGQKFDVRRELYLECNEDKGNKNIFASTYTTDIESRMETMIKTYDLPLQCPQHTDCVPSNQSDCIKLDLVDITGIRCDAPKSFCKIKKDVFEHLQQADKIAKSKGYQGIVVNEAYRDVARQRYLFELNKCNTVLAACPTCNAPHVTGGAVDIALLTKKGEKVYSSELEKVMCEAGFVRYAAEGWHFEYGTERYARAGQQCAIA